jgi:hypothetical protein
MTRQVTKTIAKDDCSGKGLDLAGSLRILNFAPPRLGHLAPASEVAGRHYHFKKGIELKILDFFYNFLQFFKIIFLNFFVEFFRFKKKDFLQF